jgi:hypothetical protein
MLVNVIAGYLHLAESKLKALSVAVRLKQPDKRFETIKNYGNELEVNVMNNTNCVYCFLFQVKNHLTFN